MKKLNKKINGSWPLTPEAETANHFERCCGAIVRYSMGFFEAMTFTK